MIRIGIICPSEIAYRRFLPALKLVLEFRFEGIAIASAQEWYGDGCSFDENENESRIIREHNKAQTFVDTMGYGKIYESYEDIVCSDSIDAIYLPLPPALHYKWAKLALEHGKHVFVEKPSTVSAEDTKSLIEIAAANQLAFHENYMFIYHDQLKAVNQIVASGELGDVRLYRISFGFPRRTQNDFRYNKALGGGALIDAGGYTLKYASFLLGETARIRTAQLNYLKDFEVDMYGSATMTNDEGVTAQLAFGMDNDYRCDIDVWGSLGTLTSNRILTAPAGYVPECVVKKNQTFETRQLPADDSFRKSIERFLDCIREESVRVNEYQLIQKESDLVSQFKSLAI